MHTGELKIFTICLENLFFSVRREETEALLTVKAASGKKAILVASKTLTLSENWTPLKNAICL